MFMRLYGIIMFIDNIACDLDVTWSILNRSDILLQYRSSSATEGCVSIDYFRHSLDDS